MLNITIRVAANQARREINSVAKEIKRAQSMSGGTGMGPAESVAKRFGMTGRAAISMAQGVDRGLASMKRFGAALPGILSKMESTGKNMQWVGRQLTFNFTLPLVAAGTMATKWALDNERAMTRVRKVYGDASFGPERVRKETDALSKSFEMLSTRYGILQSDVINIAGDWAQAGAAGRGLAEATKLTMEAMIIGEVEATQATQGLIAMMSAYHLSAAPKAGQRTSELAMQLAKLNAIENQTSIDMGGLIGVIQRAGSAAAASGIELDQLAAFAAALVPTAGSAAQAGNGLKTMFTRLVKPTVETTNMLKALGLVTSSKEWLGANVADRILMISERFRGLSDSQKLTAEATIAGAWQFNRFAALMNDIANPLGNYHRALQAVGKEQLSNGKSANVLTTYQKELAAVLNSNPKRFDILTNSIKNSLASAILPLLPAIQSLLGMIAGLAKSFAGLDPQTQKFIMFALMFVAIVGPIVQMMGATILLTKELGAAAMWSGKKLAWVGRQVFSMAQNLWDFFARLLLQQGTVSGAWTSGEAGRAAATTAANAQITASTTATMGAIGAGYTAAAAQGTGAAAITGASWNTAAITSATGWGMAMGEIGGGQLALTAHTGRMAAGMAAAHAAAAGTVGQVWIVTNASLVGVTTIAGNQITTVWIGTAAAIVGVWDAMLAHMMGGYAALGTGSAVGAELAAAPWKLQAIEVAAIETTAMSTAAASQALVPTAALPAATTTTAIWATAGTAIKGAMLHPIAAIAASFKWLGGIIVKGLVTALGGIAAAVGLPVWAVVAIIAAVATAIVLILKTDIEKPVWDTMKSIGRAIWALPQVFVAALAALARAVARAVQTVLRWLSYLNPFARHSPSLVDNVRAGVATILDEYSRLKAIGPMIREAAEAHEAFNRAVKQSGHDPQQRERAEQRQIIAEQAPSVLPSFDNMAAQADRLEAQLPALKAEIQGQAAVVAQWEAKLKSIDATLKTHQDILSDLEGQLSDLGDQISEAQSEIDRLGSTDLPGMRAMSNAIFENEMAQKRLRLEIMKLEEAGQSVDDLKERMAALNGEIDLLRGEREDLRLAGAGSDILGVYDAEIAALEAQRQALEGQGDEITQLASQLEELQRQGEILSLEQSINFDPQLRQIDQMIEGLNEMPFDQIVAQIGQQQEKLAQLQPQYDALNAKVEQERATVEAIQKQRDAVADTLDVEQQKLQDLESAYSDIESQIRDMTSSMQEFSAAAKEAASSTDPAALFEAGAGLDFEDVMGTGGLMPEGGLPDIEDFNKQLQKDLEDAFGAFDDMDPFKGIKDKFSGFIGFIKDWGRLIGPVVIGALLGGWPLVIGLIVGIILKWGPQIFGALQTAFGVAVTVVSTVFRTVGNVISTAWSSVIYPVLSAIGSFLMAVFTPAWNALATVVQWAWNTVIAPVISAAWTVIKPVFDALWGFINGYLVPIFQLFAAIVEIAIVGVYKIIEVQIRLAIAIFQEIWSFMNGSLGPVFTWLWQNIVQPAMNGIGSIISFAWNNVIKPVVNALWVFLKDVLGPVFTWLWQNIVQPAFSAIGTVISTAWNAVISPIFEALKTGIGLVAEKITWLKDHVFAPVWEGITTVVRNAWNTMAGVLEAGINFFIRIFNALADGVEKIAGMIGISVTIKKMDPVDLTMESGGQLPAYYEAGGKMGGWDPTKMGPMITNGIRAIVGEGSPIHPEFVIPTDPKWRARAVKLYQMLGNKLGRPNVQMHNTGGQRAVGRFASGGIPMLAPGDLPGWGIVKDVGGAVKDVGGAVYEVGKDVGGALRKGAVMAAFAPFLAIANQLIGMIPNEKIKDVATKIKNDVYNWAKGEDDKLPDATAAGGGPGVATGAGNQALVGNRAHNRMVVQEVASGRNWGTGIQWDNLAALVNKESGWNNLAQNPTSTAYGLFQFLNSTWAGTGYSKTSDPRIQTLAGLKYISNRYGTPVDAWNFHKKNNWYESGGILNLAQGGIIKRQAGGVLARIGEGRYDEAVSDMGGKVQVLPLDGHEGGNHYEFHGDLSFPNVKSGDDAQSFLDNLEALTGLGGRGVQ